VADIAVLVPVLGRPANAAPLAESLAASTDRARLVFVCTWADLDQISAVAETGAEAILADWQPGPGDYARKIQVGYDATDEPLVLLGADDLRFRPGWLEAVERVAEEFDVGVVGTNDLGNPVVVRGEHSTHPVVRRCYIDSRGGVVDYPGMVYWPGYDHNGVDVELVETAKARGCYAHAHDAIIEHLHPLWRKAEEDATYRKGMTRARQDHRLVEARRRIWERERVTA
jgi:hypothetical protein